MAGRPEPASSSTAVQNLRSNSAGVGSGEAGVRASYVPAWMERARVRTANPESSRSTLPVELSHASETGRLLPAVAAWPQETEGEGKGR